MYLSHITCTRVEFVSITVLTIVRVFRNCGICCRWKTPHKKKVKQHLVDRTTSQPRRKSDRIAATPVVNQEISTSASTYLLIGVKIIT
jgi:hypothetical protein